MRNNISNVKKCCLNATKENVKESLINEWKKIKLKAFRKTNDQLVELANHANQTCSNK